MNLDLTPRKTPRAREALQHRDSLPRHHRSFLIMVDGRKSLRDLSEAARQLGIDAAAIASLTNNGLLHWHGEGRPSDASSPRAVRAATNDDPKTPRPTAPAPTLAATKLYALDLALLMLPRHDGVLRDSARAVVDADSLRRWLDTTQAMLAERAGPDRATLFMTKVGAMLPSDFCVPASACDATG